MNVPAQRPVPIENVFQPIVTMVWKLAFWAIAMLALVTVGKIWLRGQPSKQRRGDAKRTPPRMDPTPDPVARPTEWTAAVLRSLEWKRLEELCEGFWKAKGYPARGTGPGSDGGVDVVIADRQDADRIFAVAQCKAWSKPVGVEPVRALWGAKHHFGAQLAIFYSVSSFSTEASNFAAGKHLKLVSGDELLRQLQTLAEAERTALLRHVTRGDFSTPSCPKCEIKMIRKAGRAGRSDFWSCPNFRSCRTRPIAVRDTA